MKHCGVQNGGTGFMEKPKEVIDGNKRSLEYVPESPPVDIYWFLEGDQGGPTALLRNIHKC